MRGKFLSTFGTTPFPLLSGCTFLTDILGIHFGHCILTIFLYRDLIKNFGVKWAHLS